jgi:hypothetical protein
LLAATLGCDMNSTGARLARDWRALGRSRRSWRATGRGGVGICFETFDGVSVCV